MENFRRFLLPFFNCVPRDGVPERSSLGGVPDGQDFLGCVSVSEHDCFLELEVLFQRVEFQVIDGERDGAEGSQRVFKPIEREGTGVHFSSAGGENGGVDNENFFSLSEESDDSTTDDEREL